MFIYQRVNVRTFKYTKKQVYKKYLREGFPLAPPLHISKCR